MYHPTLPPGPRISAVWQLLRYTPAPLTFLGQCARRYGTPFTMRLAGYGTLVMLTDGEAIKDVFRGDPHALHSGEGNEFLSLSVGRLRCSCSTRSRTPGSGACSNRR